MPMADTDKRLTEVLKRRTTGILLAAALLALWYVQGWPLRVGLMLMMVLSVHEMQSAFAARGAKPARFAGLVYAALAMPAYLFYGTGALAPLTVLMCVAALTAIVLRGEADFESAAATLFPLFYPGLPLALLFPLMDIEPRLLGTVMIGLSFLVALVNDIAAYEVGRRYGRTKLCPALSPKKTVEGALAGVVASVAIALAVPPVAEWATRIVPAAAPFQAALPPFWHFALIGLLGGLAAPLGDLTASMVKRHCGIKDYGNLFPGHGGMLDRIDSVVFTGAMVHIYCALVLKLL